jgi:hypothetical protein
MIARAWRLVFGFLRNFWERKVEEARAPLAEERHALEERAGRVEVEIKTIGRASGAR